MPKQNRGGPRLLVTAREGALYLERARVHVDGGRVVYYITDDELGRAFNIPHVNLAVLFLGQGTSITQDAMRLLGEEKVHLAFTGTGGTPMHMGALTTYSNTRHFRDLLPVYMDPARSLIAAKQIMHDRIKRMNTLGCTGVTAHLQQYDHSALKNVCTKFTADLKTCTDIQQLLGMEGQFAKRCYKVFADLSGVSNATPFKREPGQDDHLKPHQKETHVNLINRLIDHGNYLCYGMAGAALWALGIPPHMSVLHGKTRAGGLVFDVADSFKDALVLPLAFAPPPKSKDKDPEKVFREKLISAFDNHKILTAAISTVERMTNKEAQTEELQSHA